MAGMSRLAQISSAELPIVLARRRLRAHGSHMNTTERPRIIGMSKCRDGETGTCSHCGREIKRIVYLSNGSEVGLACARRLSYSQAEIDRGARVFRSVEELLAACAGGGGLVLVDGKVMRRLFRAGVPVLEVA